MHRETSLQDLRRSKWTCGAALLAVLGGAGLLPPAAFAQPPQTKPPLTLTLQQAVERALKNNLQAQLAREGITQARGEKGLGLSALLPNLSGAAYQTNLTSNLAAMGLTSATFPGLNPFVGPFSRFDARVQLVQSVFNLASIRRYQAAVQGLALAREEQRSAEQRVVIATVLSYVAVIEARQSVEAAQADVHLAKRLLELATSQRNAGIATGIDVTRAETRLASQEVRLAQARTDLDTARLNLLRVTGSPLESELTLAESMRFAPEALPGPEDAVQKALADRVEIRSAQAQVRIATAQKQAAVAGWAPSVSFFGDYGTSAVRPLETSLPTRSVGIRLDVPVFDGGRTRSEVQVAASRLRQAEMRLNDLRADVEKEVRQALDNLATRREQVQAAQKALGLAERELELAQDRFRNGVGDNIEVVNAQTALENARQSVVASLTLFNVARLNLAAAMGHVEDFRL
jgi:TolC family type I secretion outer membrane protein